MLKRVLVLMLGLQVLVAVGAFQAGASVVLKANGRDAVPLRVKGIEARAVIRGQFASTTSVMTFANETSQRIEADFLMTVPDGTVVTYFAYWYGEEKVVARIVEKERAAAIYQHITTRMRDPALVEMIGRNTFRARIFPVMPNADLRVEMRWGQVLESTPLGLKYRFPLAPEEVGKGILDTLDLQVDVEPDGSQVPIVSASNNYRQPIERRDGHLRTQLKQNSFGPDKDFELNLDQRAAGSSPPPLRASMFAARSGGRDGFFALALTSSRDIRRPRLSLRGVRAYDLSPRVLPAMKAGQAIVVCGRYSGGGAGVAELAGVGSARLGFDSRAENDNLATRLWAARRIEELSVSERNRAAVLKLSHQFTLPSKWSSWLAVPQEELQRFKQEKLQAELEVLGRRYALEVAHNGVQSPRARALKQQFEAMRAQADFGGSPEDAFATVAYELAQQRALEGASERPNRRLMARLQRQIDTLNRLSGNRVDRSQMLQSQMSVLSQELVQEEASRGSQTRRARQLRLQLKGVAKALGYGAQWDGYYTSMRSEKASHLASEYVRARYEKGDAQSAARSSRQLENLSGPREAKAGIRQARLNWGHGRVYTIATLLAEEKSQPRPDARRLRQLEAQITRTEKQAGVVQRQAREAAFSQWSYSKLPPLAEELVRAKYAQAPDAARIAGIQARINRVARVVPSGQLFNYEQYPLMNLMRQSQQSYVEELRRDKPDRARLQVLEARMASLYADPKYNGVVANETTVGKDQNPLRLPKIAALRHQVDDLDAQLQARPDAAQKAVLQQAKREKVERLAYATRFHLRLGDPLISIDAPRDAAQVVAIMPDAQVKRLLWNDASRRWQARFDIPSHAVEGAYRITVIVVEKNGARHETIVNYSVDMTPPTGQAQAQTVAPDASPSHAQPMLRLEISGDKDTARVFALLPWSEKVELKLSPIGANRFFALAPIPVGHQPPAQVTYILTDRAHNRTTISVDVTR